ncbi:hypothetical protein DC498_16635 [Terrimonas sp.]|uniref:DUF262 domain-containing protein n=1 Tax=Terrimonas sp. TaxID=1914338 RepID=UPI000D522F42|nr:DUF262 domain-containing protein [Terrimonas sp.]PVD51044.1 hypothetical protein DC498_16635 [Terrimonas sp.]
MISIKKYSLRQLKRKFENRDFAIPEIQRQYVWKKQQILKLMDSIFRNYPIGIGLVWNAPFSKAINIRPNNKTIVPPFNKKAKHAELIIDGQQRLSTIYGVIMGVEERPDAGSDINFRHLFFNCDKKADRRFVFSSRYDENTKGYIRLFDLLNTQPALLKRRLGLTNWETIEASKCYKAFHHFSFLLLMFTGSNVEDIREVFVRINSAGMRVNRADTLFAKATDVSLRDNILDTKRGLKHSYNFISNEAMQSALGLAYGATTITGRALESVLTKIEKNKKYNGEFTKIWKSLQYGYEEAVDFLVNHLKVNHPSLLPYQNIYTLLAFFFYLNKSRAKPSQIKEIKKWFWFTACGERYSGAAFNRNIPEDIKFFKRLAKNNGAKFISSEKISPLDFLKMDYQKSSSVAKAYFLLLRSKKPSYLANGYEMMLDNTSSFSNRKDRHHIFPKAHLRRIHINPKWINSICNICYVEADENQSISDVHPRNYLKEYKKHRHFSRVMRSHLIPASTTSPVWDTNNKRSFLNFFNARGKVIISEIEKLAGAKLFDKLDEIKRI